MKEISANCSSAVCVTVSNTLHVHMYMRVCVCVCVCAPQAIPKSWQAWRGDID